MRTLSSEITPTKGSNTKSKNSIVANKFLNLLLFPALFMQEIRRM